LKYGKQRILKTKVSNVGYKQIVLMNNSVRYYKPVHQLVAMAFLNHKPNGYSLVVNHIDFNKLNNNVENLEIVTPRENSNRKHLKSTSKYIGVCWDKNKKRWVASISLNGKYKRLGRFKDELKASEAYQTALNKL